MTDAPKPHLLRARESGGPTLSTPRPLPWSGPEGRPAALIGDGGFLSRRADQIDAVHLEAARSLWDLAPAVLENPKADVSEIRFAAAHLHESLGHLLRMTSARGLYLAVSADHMTSLHVKRWPYDPRCVSQARHDLRGVLLAWDLPDLTERAELVLSELLTNAVRYADAPDEGEIETRYERLRNGVRIEVHDADSRRPQLLDTSADAENGRGLALVAALTGGSWGAGERDGVGKLVWAAVTADEVGELAV
jgi:anti-sigma regulatory factor (Ser/Thr protein kinase)